MGDREGPPIVIRMLLLSILLSAFGVACGGGGSTSATPSTPLAITVNGKPAANVILLPATFLSPNSDIATLGTSGGGSAPVQWSVSSGSAAVLGDTNPYYVFGSPTPPPNGTFVMIAPPVAHVMSTGMVTVVARSGNESASIPVYVYEQVALGCGLRYQPYYSFESGSVTQATASDLYVTEPPTTGDPFDPCSTLGLATDTTTTFHFPYGGVLVAGTMDSFPQITASQWHDAQTQITESDALAGIVLFKTRSGAIVKAILPVGPIEASGTNGVFPY